MLRRGTCLCSGLLYLYGGNLSEALKCLHSASNCAELAYSSQLQSENLPDGTKASTWKFDDVSGPSPRAVSCNNLAVVSFYEKRLFDATLSLEKLIGSERVRSLKQVILRKYSHRYRVSLLRMSVCRC